MNETKSEAKLDYVYHIMCAGLLIEVIHLDEI